MKTREGVEIKLGECTLMPVKEIPNTEINDYVYNFAIIGDYALDNLEKISPLKSIEMIKEAYMPKSPILSVMEENYIKKYIPKMLMHLKPANYKD